MRLKQPLPFLVTLHEHAVRLGRLASDDTIMLQGLTEQPLASFNLKQLTDWHNNKLQSGFAISHVAIYPKQALFTLFSTEGKKIQEAKVINDLVVQQFRVDPSQYTLLLFDPTTGLQIEPSKAPKFVLLVGLETAHVQELQSQLLELGLYPQHITLALLNKLHALQSYLQFGKQSTTVALIQVEAVQTRVALLSAAKLESLNTIAYGADLLQQATQKEFNLPTLEAAQGIIYADLPQFEQVMPLVSRHLIKDLQAIINAHEIQVGDSITHLVFQFSGANMPRLGPAIAQNLNIPILPFNPAAWLKSHNITAPDNLELHALPMLGAALITKGLANA